VTEGEIDALTVSQLQDNKWPVVSIPHGAQTAVKAVKRDLEWLLSFETVVLAFDMDEPGQAAAQACAHVLPLGKVRIAKLPAPFKDANDVWVAGKVAELTSALWNAEEFKLDGIVTAAEMAPTILEKPVMGAPWKWEALTKLTYGRRDGELYGFGGATGGGKTDFFAEQIEYDACVLGEPTGLLFLEQDPRETMKRIMGKHLSKRLHVPEGGWTDADLGRAAEIAKDLPLYLFNHFGAIEWSNIKARIHYMVKSLGCRSIFLDHLTALTAGEEDETKSLNKLMGEMATMAKDLRFRFHYISHLATPEGKPHEEGGRVMLRHFRGSRAIGFWTHFAFGLERDQQAEDKDARLTTTLRCLKDRYTGTAAGELLFFKYDQETGRSNECDKPPVAAPDASGFRDHGPNPTPDY
jgi:twinkle protein